MSFEGTVQNGVVGLADGHQLPEGTWVEVFVREAPGVQATLRDRLLKLAGTVDDLPADMARNHDHYIPGVAKR
jgi:hypothetical protein